MVLKLVKQFIQLHQLLRRQLPNPIHDLFQFFQFHFVLLPAERSACIRALSRFYTHFQELSRY